MTDENARMRASIRRFALRTVTEDIDARKRARKFCSDEPKCKYLRTVAGGVVCSIYGFGAGLFRCKRYRVE